MRKKLDLTPPEDITPRPLDIVEQERKYELITPLYGGGVAPVEPDPVTVMRATEIRGQLRFWWHVMRGGQAEGDQPLKTREDAIWGKAYEKGDKGIPPEQTVQIIVDVDPAKRGRAIKPFEVQRGRPRSINGIPGYAAFPLQPDREELRKPQPFIPNLWEGIGFTLSITYPVRWREEIEAALWAWETFGGLGARTRRGFGALHLLEIDGLPYHDLPTSRDVGHWIQDKVCQYSKEGSFPPDLPFPHLLRSNIQFAVTSSTNKPLQAWSDLIRKLQDFRQQKDEHNRSAWPEADAIRKIDGRRTKNIPPGPQKFPRAAFGLPIIFHFTGKDAPEDYTLNETDMNEADTQNQKLESKERFASPLILRPFLCSDKRAVGLALLLEGSRVDLQYLVLQDKKKRTHSVQGTLTTDEARSLTNQLTNLKNETDVLQAFIRFFQGV